MRIAILSICRSHEVFVFFRICRKTHNKHKLLHRAILLSSNSSKRRDPQFNRQHHLFQSLEPLFIIFYGKP